MHVALNCLPLVKPPYHTSKILKDFFSILLFVYYTLNYVQNYREFRVIFCSFFQCSPSPI